jgi:hypothetical protein
MPAHETPSTKHQRSPHPANLQRSGQFAHFQCFVHSFHVFSPPMPNSSESFIHPDAFRSSCQKTVISTVRTALIVTTRTIILMGHFVPPERNDTHNQIGDDTVSTITRQGSVKPDQSLWKKLNITIHYNNRTGFRVQL